MSERHWLYAMGTAALFVAALTMASLYVGWRLGRQGVEERVVVPAPTVSVAPAHTTVDVAPTTVRVEPPSVTVEVPEAPAPRVEVRPDSGAVEALRELQEAQRRSSEESVAILARMAEEVRAAREELARAAGRPQPAATKAAAKVTDRDEHGELLPPPRDASRNLPK